MLRDLQALLAMSAAGTAAVLLAMAAGRFCRARGRYVLRLAALGLFLLPVGLLLAPRAPAVLTKDFAASSGFTLPFALPAPSGGVLFHTPIAAEPPFWARPELWAILWLGGTALFLLLTLARRVRLARRRARLPLQKPSSAAKYALRKAAANMGIAHPPALAVCPGLVTPMLAGLWHSRILLPEYVPDQEELIPILSHELRHFRQGDLWIWLFAELACCLHWWNPAAWILRRQLICWGESACDEAVAAQLSPAQKRAYGRAILNVIARAGKADFGEIPGAAPLSAGGQAVKERLERIMNSQKMTKKAKALTLALTLAVGVGGTLVACGLSPERPPAAPPAAAATSFAPESSPSLNSSGSQAKPDDRAAAVNPEREPGSASSDELSAAAESWAFPLAGDGITVAAPFGYNRSSHRGHRGVDYGYRDANGKNVGQGKPIYAVKSGTVSFAGWKGSNGNLVEIDHGGGELSRYAHCAELLVKPGDTVRQGQQIATVGSTGNSTGDHLHMELSIGGEFVDPALYLPIPSAQPAPSSGGA